MELKICHLYPDVLLSNGDGGNLLCLRRRCQWRGIEVSVTQVPLGSEISLAGFDLIYCGGSQDFPMDALLAELKGKRGEEIRSTIEDGVPFLAVCAGFLLLGKYFQTLDGTKQETLGALDCYTVEKSSRLTGNCLFRWGEETLVGFENHSGHCYLGDGLEPLGSVVCGKGNNGSDGTEGAHYKNTFATWCHGPLLPQNPRFCDHILETALCRKYGSVSLEPLDDRAETLSHNEMVERLSQ